MPWVAAAQPPQREPRAAQSSETLNRLERVCRARRMKPAIVAEHGTQRVAIRSQQIDEYDLQGNFASN
jgi:hypothetical protein